MSRVSLARHARGSLLVLIPPLIKVVYPSLSIRKFISVKKKAFYVNYVPPIASSPIVSEIPSKMRLLFRERIFCAPKLGLSPVSF